jgi:ABC-2 type transport system permease protein
MKTTLSHTSAMAWREYKAYFTSPIAYVYLTTFIIIVNWLFFRSFFVMGQADLRGLFGMMPWMFLFFVPAVSMGKWADERKQGTIEILFTLPVRGACIIISKFLAGLMLIVTATLLTLPIAVTAAYLGKLDMGPVICGYIGLIFLGGAYLSIGLAASSVTENQIIAFILGVAACFIMLVLGTPLITGGTSSSFTSMIQYIGLATHFESISRGVLELNDVFYYISVVFFFLFVNKLLLDIRARR